MRQPYFRVGLAEGDLAEGPVGMLIEYLRFDTGMRQHAGNDLGFLQIGGGVKPDHADHR